MKVDREPWGKSRSTVARIFEHGPGVERPARRKSIFKIGEKPALTDVNVVVPIENALGADPVASDTTAPDQTCMFPQLREVFEFNVIAQCSR